MQLDAPTPDLTIRPPPIRGAVKPYSTVSYALPFVGVDRRTLRLVFFTRRHGNLFSNDGTNKNVHLVRRREGATIPCRFSSPLLASRRPYRRLQNRGHFKNDTRRNTNLLRPRTSLPRESTRHKRPNRNRRSVTFQRRRQFVNHQGFTKRPFYAIHFRGSRVHLYRPTNRLLQQRNNRLTLLYQSANRNVLPYHPRNHGDNFVHNVVLPQLPSINNNTRRRPPTFNNAVPNGNVRRNNFSTTTRRQSRVTLFDRGQGLFFQGRRQFSSATVTAYSKIVNDS